MRWKTTRRRAFSRRHDQIELTVRSGWWTRTKKYPLIRCATRAVVATVARSLNVAGRERRRARVRLFTIKNCPARNNDVFFTFPLWKRNGRWYFLLWWKSAAGRILTTWNFGELAKRLVMYPFKWFGSKSPSKRHKAKPKHWRLSQNTRSC